MKHSITNKLILYISLIILLFTTLVVSFFGKIYLSTSIKREKENLEVRATAMAGALEDYFTLTNQTLEDVVHEYGFDNKGEQQAHQNKKLETETFDPEESGETQLSQPTIDLLLDLFDGLSVGDIWLVDESGNKLSLDESSTVMNYEPLPEQLEEMISNIREEQTTVTQVDESVETIGVPIFDESQTITAVLLLREENENITGYLYQGIQLLIGICAGGLVLAIIGIVILSKTFTKPLKKMADNTHALIEGNYDIHNEIVQKDEIGDLGNSLNALAVRLKKAQQESEALEQMRKDYIANVSHELRTPITVIRGSLEALQDGVVSTEEGIQTYYQAMNQETKHLERMVNDLLELSRLQNVYYPMDFEELNVVEVLKDALRGMKFEAEKAKITLDVKIEQAVYRMQGDPGRLRQMFLSVLNNAVKFSKTHSTIWIESHFDGRKGTISIRDEGQGIPKEDLSFIFTKFYKTKENNQMGSGLGLAIANEIADRHGIKIDVTSELNQGTNFTFIFAQQGKKSKA